MKTKKWRVKEQDPVERLKAQLQEAKDNKVLYISTKFVNFKIYLKML